MKSLSYYLTIGVIKLKGLKKIFSQDPVDYQKLRKEDLRSPKSKSFRPHILRQFEVSDSSISEISPQGKNDCLVLYIHGGAFVSGPAKHHWDSLKKIVSRARSTTWMLDYPKAPETKIDAISANIDAVFAEAMKSYPAHKIILMGDSVGATLCTALTQRLLEQKAASPLALVLISPVMDASFENPAIDKTDPSDPMLSKTGILSAKKMCAVDGNLNDPRISPLRGNFKGFPPTLIFIAGKDIMRPDEELAVQKMKAAQAPVHVIHGDGMPHIWPILPVMKEAKTALSQAISFIQQHTG